MIIGDLNARTGNLDDTILPDKYDEVFNISTNHTHKRNSQDKEINHRGSELLELCKALDINIINGRTTGDLFGSYTMFNWNGSSVVDYLLSSGNISHKVLSFKVGEFTPWLSDHCPIYSTIELSKDVGVNCPLTPKKKAPLRFVWSETGKRDYLNMLNSPEYSKTLENALNLDYGDPNSVVNYVSDLLISVAKKAKVKTTKKKEQKNPPWFDRKCSKMKQNIKSLGKNSEAIKDDLSI